MNEVKKKSALRFLVSLAIVQLGFIVLPTTAVATQGKAAVSCTKESIAAEKLDVCRTFTETNNKVQKVTNERHECCPKDTFCCSCGANPTCCPKGGKCTEDGKCLSAAESATCVAWGDPHYTTFDNAKMDYQGTCKLLMVNATSGTPIAIYTQNYRLNDPTVSYVGIFEVVYNKITLRIERVAHKKMELWVMQRDDNVDIKKHGAKQTLPYSKNGVEVTQCGAHFILKTQNNVTVSYDGEWDGKIHVPAYYAGKVTGMCGNFDGDANNDFKTMDGKLLMKSQAEINKIGDSYVVPDPAVTDNNACKKHDPEKVPESALKNLVQGACSMILDPKGPLSNCSKAISTARFQNIYDSCMFDGCIGGYSTVCQSYKVAASLCQDVGRQNNAISPEDCFYDEFATIIGGTKFITFDSYPLFLYAPAKVLVSKPKPTSQFPYFEIRSETRKNPTNNELYLYMIELIDRNNRIQIVRNDAAKPPFTVHISKTNADDLKHSTLPVDQQRAYIPSGVDGQGLGSKVQIPYDSQGVQITQKDFSVSVLTNYGVRIMSDFAFTNVFVPKEYKGQVEGLFGNYDSNSGNDNLLKNGQPSKGDNIGALLQKDWIIYDKFCANANVNQQQPAVKPAPDDAKCMLITNINGIFKPCLHSKAIYNKAQAYKLTCNQDAVLRGPKGACDSLASFQAICWQYGHKVDAQNTCGCNVPHSIPEMTYSIPAIPPLVLTFAEIPKLPPILPIPPLSPIPSLESNLTPIESLPDLSSIPPIDGSSILPGTGGSRPPLPGIGSRPPLPSIESRPPLPGIGSRPPLPSIGSRPPLPGIGDPHTFPIAGHNPSTDFKYPTGEISSRPNSPPNNVDGGVY